MVRLATIDDIDLINNFKTKLSLFKLKYENPSLNIIDECNNINSEDCIYLIAIKDDMEVGYLYGYVNDKTAILDQIYVMDKYRENGVGEELVLEFKNWSIHKSLKNIEVNIENGNEAYFLFDKLGFEITKVKMNINI